MNSKSVPAGRRQLLWNVSEPGDPYDIKKSMIGKLPGDKKIFMGNHLELVCLLQAAQIERICQFLDDYKLKFREIQRSNLDRHSYQIQIKELTQRIEDEQATKNENSKLVEFIKKQQAEIEYLQSISRDSSASADGFKQGYEKSLEFTNQVTNQNVQLKRHVEELRNELLNIRARFQAFEKSKNMELEHAKSANIQSSNENYQAGLNSIKLQYEGQLRKYDIEVKRLKELNDAKNSEINDLMKQREELARRLNALQNNNDLERERYDYQNKFVMLGQEIQRLNIALRDYANKIQESDAKKRQLERTVERNQFQKRDLEGKLLSNMNEVVHLGQLVKKYEEQSRKQSEAQQFIAQYQLEISNLERNINDLDMKLRNQSEVSRKYREESERLNFQNSRYQLLQKQNNELRGVVEQVAGLRRKIVEDENIIAIMKDEIERLQSVIKSKDGQIERSKIIFTQNEGNKSKIRQLESTIVNKYEYEMSRIRSDYQSKLENLNRSKGSEIQGRSQQYQQEIERLRQSIRVKNQQGQKLRQKVFELETLISRNDLEISAKIRNYQAQIGAMRKDNQELFNKSKMLGQSERKVFQLQSKLQQTEIQLDRLSQVLRQSQAASQNYQNDMNRQKAVYEQNLASLKNENEDLKRKINENNRMLVDASNQIERLGQNLRKIADQKGQIENSLRQLSQESSIDKQKVQKSTFDNEQLLRRIVQFEGKVNHNTNHIRGIQQQNQNLRRQLLNSKNTINNYQGELNSLNVNLEQALSNAGRQNEKLIKKNGQYEQKLTQMSMEFVRLNQILRGKVEEYENLDRKYKNLETEFENAKRQFKQYQISVKNKFEGQVTVSFNNLKNENQDLKRKLAELDGRYRQLHQDTSQQIQNLRRKISENDSSRTMIENEHHKKVSGYENNIANLARVNEELQRKLQEFDIALRQKNDEIVRLDGNHRNLSQQNDNLKRQWRESEGVAAQRFENDLRARQTQHDQNINRVNQQIEDLRRKLEEVGGDRSRRLGQYQTRLRDLSQEFQKARSSNNLLHQQNDVLKRKIEGYETSIANYEAEVKKRFQVAEQTMTAMKNENEDHRRKLQEKGQLARKLSQYQNRIAILSQELERLHQISRNMNQDNEQLRKQLMEKTNYSSQYEVESRNKLQNLEQNLQNINRQNNDLKRKIPEYEQRLFSLSQELERVNTAFRNKSDQEQARQVQLRQLDEIARNQGAEIQNWRRKYTDLEANSKHTIEVQVTRKYAMYEQNIAELQNKNGDFQGKIIGAMQQIQRLNNVLRLKVQECVVLTSQLGGLNNDLEETRRRLMESQNVHGQNVTNLRSQRDGLVRNMQEWEVKWRQNQDAVRNRISEYDIKIRNIEQQNERLSQALRGKTNELEMTRNKFKQAEQSNTFKVQRNFEQFQSQIETSQNENYELKRRLAETESRLGQLLQELEKLNGILRNKTEEANRYETNQVNLMRDLEEARRRLQQLSDKTRVLAEYEQKLQQISLQNKRLEQILTGKDDQLNGAHGKIRQYQGDIDTMRRQINEYEGEVRNRISGYEQNASQLKRDNQQLLRKRSQNQGKIAILSQQLERITATLRNKNDEFNQLAIQFENYKRNQVSQFQTNYKTLHQNYTAVTGEYEVAKNHLIDYESSIRKLHAEFQRLQSILQELKKERDSLFEKNKVLSQEIKRLNGLNNDLEEQTRDVRLRLTDETALQKRMSEHLSLMVVLFAQIQTLRIRVQEKQMEVVEVRKSSLAPHMV